MIDIAMRLTVFRKRQINSELKAQRSYLVLILAGLVSCMITLGSCQRAVLDQMPKMLSKEISIEAPAGLITFAVDIADTPQKRSQGLMFRKHMPANKGMLFIFDQNGHHPFWMKNTYISLDLIFFDDNFKIVGLIENAQPLSLDFLSIDSESRYVLEAIAGTIKKYGIQKNTFGHLIYEQAP